MYFSKINNNIKFRKKHSIVKRIKIFTKRKSKFIYTKFSVKLKIKKNQFKFEKENEKIAKKIV